MKPLFPTRMEDILERIDAIDPVTYAKTRNYIDGAVTHLSPYISRGVISTRFVLERVLSKGHDPKRIEKFIQELAKNIEGIEIFTGEFGALQKQFPGARFVFKEHPLNQYDGTEEPCTFLHDGVAGFHKSFFQLWKKLRPLLLESALGA